MPTMDHSEEPGKIWYAWEDQIMKVHLIGLARYEDPLRIALAPRSDDEDAELEALCSMPLSKL